MKPQTSALWKGLFRWLRLTYSMGVLGVGLTTAVFLALMILQAKARGSLGESEIAIALVLAVTAGIGGLSVGIIGRDTIWIAVLSVLISLGLVAFVTRFWIETYRETSGFFGKHFVADLFICFLFIAAGTVAVAAIAATLVMVCEAKCGSQCAKGSPKLPKT